MPGLPEGEEEEVVQALARLLAYVHLADDEEWGLISGAGAEGDGPGEADGGIPEEDPGFACLRWLFEALQIDDEWSEWAGRSFRWWPHRVMQRAWAEPATREPELGLTVARVHVETEVVRGVGIPMRDAKALASVIVPDPTMNALIVDDVVRFHAAVVVHEENLSWVGRLLQLAALAQVSNAELIAEDAGRAFRGQPAFSSHPARGPRPVPDEMLGALYFIPERDAPSAWAHGLELAATARVLELRGLAPSLRPGALAVDLPGRQGGSRIHRLEVTTGPHEVLGGGVRLRLHPAGWPRAPVGAKLFPVDLNHLEVVQGLDCHLIGSWTVDPAAVLASEAKPYFNCFIPNALFRPGALVDLVLSMGIRAWWVDALIDPAER